MNLESDSPARVRIEKFNINSLLFHLHDDIYSIAIHHVHRVAPTQHAYLQLTFWRLTTISQANMQLVLEIQSPLQRLLKKRGGIHFNSKMQLHLFHIKFLLGGN